MERQYLTADLLVIGGGTAGCYAAITAARRDPDLRILIAEKANIRRSGCLAAGVNALNAYIHPDESPESYLDYVRSDAEEIIREDLVLTMARGFNRAAKDLEEMGLVILKDEQGAYARRGRRNIKINGENIKPILADEAGRYPNIQVLSRVNITDYLVGHGRVYGAVGFGVEEEVCYAVAARAVIVATGGAAGLYRPNNPGFSRHKTWYPPFNTGAGYAMGIRAGAEMTSFEMRFVALRCKDTIAPTGTLALGVGAREINALGEVYEQKYGLTTSGRAFGTAQENHEGRGPCYLRTEGISGQQDQDLLRAYLNMAPGQTLKWLESGRLPSVQNVEVEGTEPYIVGGHTGSGYWVDTGRRTTLQGLYAAGDVSGGAPGKFVTGALAEGAIAAETVLEDLAGLRDPAPEEVREAAEPFFADYEHHLGENRKPYDVFGLEEAMQKVMDEYAGGIKTGYRYHSGQLVVADRRIRQIAVMADGLTVTDPDDLVRVYELRERLTLCRSVIAHLQARKETRWPGFAIHTEYPDRDPACEYYVNSRMEKGEIHVFTRPLVKETSYEHYD